MSGLSRLGAIALASLVVVPTSSALASDELLSGYGGPGGGEQMVIGSKLLPPVNGAAGSAQGTSPSESAPAPTAPSSGRSGTKGSMNSGDEPVATQRSGSKVVYPRETQSASTLPLAGGDVLLLLAGVGVVGLIAFCLRRSGFPEQ